MSKLPFELHCASQFFFCGSTTGQDISERETSVIDDSRAVAVSPYIHFGHVVVINTHHAIDDAINQKKNGKDMCMTKLL